MKVPETMRAIYFEEFKQRPEIRKLKIPEIADTSVLVKVRATGLCRSDWHGWMGHDRDIVLPHVPGHEFAGEIALLGRHVSEWKIGDRVTTPFIQACGKCHYCNQGNQQVCLHQEQAGFTHWGSFAEYVEVRNAEVNLVRIPDVMAFDTAAVLGCRFGTAYRAIVDQAKITKDSYLLVLGCGGVGLSAIMIGQAIGAHVAAIDVNEHALELAIQCGAEEAHSVFDVDTVEKLRHWSGMGVSACLDAIGRPQLIEHGIQSLGRRGKYIQVGLMPDSQGIPEVSFEQLLAHELEIIGSHGIQGWKYSEMLEFIVDRNLEVRKLILADYSLESAVDVLMNMDQNLHAGIGVIYPEL